MTKKSFNNIKKVAQKQASQASDTTPSLSKLEASLLGADSSKDTERPYVNLKYYYPKHQCFSQWEKEQLKAFSDFCKKLSEAKWTDIYKTSGSAGNKKGFGYTKHKDVSSLPENPDLTKISPDLTWFELRVTEESRVHGFRAKDAFFLVFLDRGHDIYPG